MGGQEGWNSRLARFDWLDLIWRCLVTAVIKAWPQKLTTDMNHDTALTECQPKLCRKIHAAIKKIAFDWCLWQEAPSVHKTYRGNKRQLKELLLQERSETQNALTAIVTDIWFEDLNSEQEQFSKSNSNRNNACRCGRHCCWNTDMLLWSMWKIFPSSEQLQQLWLE